ncbi:MAG TPA: hypothetical protein VK996_05885 [Ramlibacter sp.]|nr:hypothetical protein [Ramlibacter sp.]
MAGHADPKDAYTAWKLADERAAEAEKELQLAFNSFIEKTGTQPTPDLVAEAKLLRSLANRKLTEAIKAVSHTKPAKPKS